MRLRTPHKLPKADAAALFNSHQNELIEAARAHGELLQWEAFTEALATHHRPRHPQVLTWLRDLFGLGLIEKHLAWYLVHGRLSAQRAQAVTVVHRPAAGAPPPARARPRGRVRVSPEHLRATIATGVEQARQDEARAYYAARRAAGTLPVPEKSSR